jgi:predicted ATP-grasp superfamily ATP-dependent carboligase
MPREAGTAVVTCCHTRVGYNVACGLLAAGWKVVATGRGVPSMCGHLDGVVADLVYPDPFEDPDGFASVLNDAAQRHGARAILPVHEELFMASYLRDRDRFAGPAQLVVPDFEVLLAVHDKGALPAFAAAAGVPTPRTLRVRAPEDVDRALDEVGLPMLIKPCWGSGAIGIKTLRTPEDLAPLRARTPEQMASDPFVLQEWRPGIGAGVNMLLHRGDVIAISGHHRLREVPIRGGTGSAHVTLTHEGILAAGQRLVAATPFRSGVFMVEFRYDRDSDQFFVVEFNPRYWASLGSALLSGVNFPALHLHAALEDKAPATCARTTRVVESRFVLGELKVAQELIAARQWRRLRGMFRRTVPGPLELEDFGVGGWRTFFWEVYHVVRSIRRYGNFGFQSPAKAAFFDRVYSERARARVAA